MDPLFYVKYPSPDFEEEGVEYPVDAHFPQLFFDILKYYAAPFGSYGLIMSFVSHTDVHFHCYHAAFATISLHETEQPKKVFPNLTIRRSISLVSLEPEQKNTRPFHFIPDSKFWNIWDFTLAQKEDT
jgi:hypothetical protein